MLKGIMVVLVSVVLVGSLAVPMILDSLSEPEENDDLNVFILAGQSNSAYYNADVEVANENAPIKDGFAFYYGTADAPINCGTITDMDYDTTLESYGIYSMTNSDGTFRIGNIESPFASVFVNETNQKCLIINTGIGGISINSYVPGGVGFTYAESLIEDALAKIPDEYTPVLRGVLWVQGESDSSLAVNTYISQFGLIKDGFSDLGFAPIYISETRPINGGNSTFAQKILADTESGVYMACDAAEDFTVDNGMIASDNLHYTQAGDNIIGSDLASYVIHNLGLPTNSMEQYETLVLVIPLLLVIAVLCIAFRVALLRKE